MRQGLFVDTLRGSCGTGIYTYDGKKGDVFKRALAGPDFIQTYVYDRFTKGMTNHNIVIGHNRASTIGSAKDENCHPFLMNTDQNLSVALVHNGTLNNYHAISPTGFNHAVDSAHAAAGIAAFGAEKTLEKLRGAFVLVWHDLRDNTFNIARNDFRDIWYIRSKDNNTLYFGSEWEMLDFIIPRTGLEVGKEYENPDAFMWHKWHLDNDLKKPKKIKFKEFKETKPADNRALYPWRGGSSFDSKYERDRKAEYAELLIDNPERILAKVKGFMYYPRGGQAGPSDNDYGYAELLEQHSGEEITCRINNMQYHEFKAKYLEKDYVVLRGMGIWQDAGGGSIITSYFVDHITTEAAEKELSDIVAAREVETNRNVGELFPGPSGVWVDKESWMELVETGCIWCSNPIGEADAKEVLWVDDRATGCAPLCKSCQADTDPITFFNIRAN